MVCAARRRHGIVAALPVRVLGKASCMDSGGNSANYSALYAYSKRVLYIDQDFFSGDR